MATRRTRNAVRIAMVGTVFATGFVCGSLAQRSADAQLGDVMKKAGRRVARSGRRVISGPPSSTCRTT